MIRVHISRRAALSRSPLHHPRLVLRSLLRVTVYVKGGARLVSGVLAAPRGVALPLLRHLLAPSPKATTMDGLTRHADSGGAWQAGFVWTA